MDSVFSYSKYVTGKALLGRSSETKALMNLLLAGENVALYSGPKTGKMSIIQSAFQDLKSKISSFYVIKINLLNIREDEDFVCKFGTEILKACGSTPEEYKSLVENYLEDSSFVFDPLNFTRTGSIVSLRKSLDISDVEKIFSLPYRLDRKFYIVIQEFQNILYLDHGEQYLKLLETVLKKKISNTVSFIFCGSMYNAMNEIFGIKKYFYRNLEILKLHTIETKDIIDHIHRGLLIGGKVIDKDLLLGVCTLFKNNIYYINVFFSICDSLSRGYINEPILQTALNNTLALFEPGFRSIMNDLTNYQVRLLKAILCGHLHLTNTEVIEEYGLNSSANVRRLKDALCKKEIIYFNERGEAHLLDPLFEYWVRNFFFEMKDL